MHQQRQVPLPYRRDPDCPFDPDREFARLRAEEPVVKIPLNTGEKVWLITRFADARQVLSDDRFSSELTPMGVVLPEPENRTLADELRSRQPGAFIEYDPPEHTRLRQLVAGEFTASRMELLRPRVERIVADHLDAMATAGPPADLVSTFALPVPTNIICEVLGMPTGSTFDFPSLTQIMTDVMAPIETLIPVRDQMRAEMRELVARQRREPGDNMISRIIRDNGDRVSDDELAGIALLFLIAGHETTANMLGIGMLALLTHPDQLVLLREHDELVDQAVDELVRYVSIPNHGEVRTATEDVWVNDTLIAAGEQVLVSLPSANRDERWFADPDRLDITKRLRPHLAYGHGIHYCIGRPLARLEMCVAFPALLRRFSELRLAVPAEEVPLRRSNVTYGVHALPVTW